MSPNIIVSTYFLTAFFIFLNYLYHVGRHWGAQSGWFYKTQDSKTEATAACAIFGVCWPITLFIHFICFVFKSGYKKERNAINMARSL